MPPRTRSKATAAGPSSSSQGGKRKGKARATSPPPPPPPTVITLPWPFKDAAHHDRFKALSSKPILATRYFHEATLHGLGLYEEVMRLVTNVGWRFFVDEKHATYKEITLEILSSFKIDYNPPRESDVLLVSFRCMGVDHTWNLATFSEIFGFPPFGATSTNLPDYDQESAWHELTGTSGYDPSRSKATKLRSPALRYIHKFMVHSIFGRILSIGVVSKSELLVLHSMVHRRTFYSAIFFIKHVLHVIRKPKGRICMGGLFTCMAMAVGFVPVPGRDTLVSGPDSIDFHAAVRIGLCKYMGGNDYWLLDAEGEPIPPAGQGEAVPEPHDAPMEDVHAADDGAEGTQEDVAAQSHSQAAGPSTASFRPTGSASSDHMLNLVLDRLTIMQDHMDSRFQTMHTSVDTRLAKMERTLNTHFSLSRIEYDNLRFRLDRMETHLGIVDDDDDVEAAGPSSPHDDAEDDADDDDDEDPPPTHDAADDASADIPPTDHDGPP